VVRSLEPDELMTLVGQELGASRWLTINQSQISNFADITMDRQWIHVDVERATRENGGSIAHGFLTLSLMPSLLADIWYVRGAKSIMNYGFDKLRFVAPVFAGARVRLRETMVNVEVRKSGMILTRDSLVEVEGQARPAVAATCLALVSFF
jgi:acyl dehydratase